MDFPLIEDDLLAIWFH